MTLDGESTRFGRSKNCSYERRTPAAISRACFSRRYPTNACHSPLEKSRSCIVQLLNNRRDAIYSAWNGSTSVTDIRAAMRVSAACTVSPAVPGTKPSFSAVRFRAVLVLEVCAYTVRAGDSPKPYRHRTTKQVKSTGKLSVSLIGCGAISKKHVDALVGLSASAELGQLCDIDQSRTAEMAALAHPTTGWQPTPWDDYRPMLSEAKTDIVSIATASHLHAQMAVDAFESGAHVLIEKPIGLSTADIARVLAAQKNAGTVGTVAYVLRFLPHVRALKTAVDQGRFGRIFHASITVHWNRNAGYYEQARWRGTWERDGGALMNQGTHGIDLLQWIVGSPARRVSGAIRRFQRPIEAEDFGTATVEFESGAVGTFVGSVNVHPTNHDETLSVFGENGTVVIGGKALNEVLTWTFADSGDDELTAITELARNEAGAPVGHLALYADLVDAVTNGHKPLITLEDAARSVEIVLAIYQSAKEQRSVDLPTDFATTAMTGYFD